MSFITQKGATGPLALQATGTFQTSTDVNLATLVGTRYDLSDGREVMFVSVGGTAISTNSAGLLVQDPAVVANHQDLAVTTVTAYSANGNIPPSIAVTLGATALSVNQYQGGFVSVVSGIGIGQLLRVASHPAAAASATNVTITLEDGANVALTTASVVSLWPAHGNAVIVAPTTLTGAIAGLTLYPLSAGTVGIPGTSYGFIQTKGIGVAISDSLPPAIGQPISPSVTTAGFVTAAGGTQAVIGYAAQAGETQEANVVFLNV